MAGRYVIGLGILFLFLWRFFHVHPEVDLWASHLFYQNGVWLGQREPFAFLREVYYNGSLILAAYGVIMAIVSSRRETKISHYYYAFFAWLAVLCNAILVNRGFKDFFDRARPYHTTEFGGDHLFTPAPFAPVGQCDQNCSFISGEGSGAMLLILAFVALCGANQRAKIWVWILILPMAIMRVMAGKHFLSDVVLAMLFTAWFYWLQLWVTSKMPRDLWGSWDGAKQDFLGLFGRGK